MELNCLAQARRAGSSIPMGNMISDWNHSRSVAVAMAHLRDSAGSEQCLPSAAKNGRALFQKGRDGLAVVRCLVRQRLIGRRQL